MGKKIISLVLAVILLVAGTTTAFGQEMTEIAGTKNELTQSVTINEFDAMLQTASESTVQLLHEGYSTKEIEAIKNYSEEYREYIESLNEREDAMLEKWGYTSTEINIIRNFNGTEAEMRALSAKVTVSITPLNFEYDKTKIEEERYSVGTLMFSWK